RWENCVCVLFTHPHTHTHTHTHTHMHISFFSASVVSLVLLVCVVCLTDGCPLSGPDLLSVVLGAIFCFLVEDAIFCFLFGGTVESGAAVLPSRIACSFCFFLNFFAAFFASFSASERGRAATFACAS